MLLKTLFKRQYFWYHKLDILESSNDRRSPRETLRKKIQNTLTWYIVSQKVLLPAIFIFPTELLLKQPMPLEVQMSNTIYW